ncbi:MAG: lasso peptide biosynthesis B2 protein [Acidimicrobiales bacterium]
MLRALKTAITMDAGRRRLALRCGFELVRASAQLAVVRRSAISPLLGDARPALDPAGLAPASDADLRLGIEVGRLVARIAAVLPWHPGCLRQVLACRRTLTARGVETVIHLGVADAATLGAHAWVSVGNIVVNGAGQQEAHTPLASYRGR